MVEQLNSEMLPEEYLIKTFLHLEIILVIFVFFYYCYKKTVKSIHKKKKEYSE